MFSADISQVQFWEDSRDQRNTHGDNLDYLFPKFSHPSPWLHRSASGKASLLEDFILIAEFSEQEGPRPVIVIPKDGGGDFDQNEFSVKILAVDHQSSIVEGSNMTEDAQVVMWDTDKNAHAFIHHIVLNDIQARGYVRPFCISYVTADSQKIMKCYDTISTQMRKVAKMMKYGNRLVFMRDLEKYLEDLDYTKAHLLISQRSLMSTAANDNEVLTALNTIRQSMEEVKDIMSKLRNMLNDTELQDKFQAFEQRLKSNKEETVDSCDDRSSLKDFPTYTKESDMETSGSYTDRLTPEFSLFGKSKDLKPKLLDVSTLKGKRRFDRSLRGLHELCSWGAREGLRKLRSIREYLMRDYSSIYMDELDEKVSSPDSSLLSFGYDTIGANFLTCYSSRDAMFCKKKNCSSHPRLYQHSLGSVDSFKSLPSSYYSIQDEDTLYSAQSSMAEGSSQRSAFERQASITDSFETRASSDDHEEWMFHQDGDVESGQEYSTSVIHSSFLETIKYEARDDTLYTYVNTTDRSSDSEFDIIDTDRDLTCSAPGCKCNNGSNGKMGGTPSNHKTRLPSTQTLTDVSCNTDAISSANSGDNEAISSAYSGDTVCITSAQFDDKTGNRDLSIDVQNTNTRLTEISKGIVLNIGNLGLNQHEDIENEDTDYAKKGDEIKDSVRDSIMNESTTTLCDNNEVSVIKTTIDDTTNVNCDGDTDSQCDKVSDSQTNLEKGNDSGTITDYDKESDIKSTLAEGQTETSDEKHVNNSIDTSMKPTSVLSNQIHSYNNSDACCQTMPNNNVRTDKRADFTANQSEEDAIKDHLDEIEDSSLEQNEGASFFIETDSQRSDTDSLESQTEKLNIEREKLKQKIENTLYMGGQLSNYARRKEKLFLPFSNKIEADNTCVQCLQKVLCGYNNLQHVIYSLLSGRPVVIVCTRRTEEIMREMVYALTIFTPIVPSTNVSSLLCQIKQLKMSDIHKVQLRGVIRSENRPIDYLIPHSVRRYITLVDVDKMQLYAQPYQGMLLNFVSSIHSKKRSFKSERALYNYIQMCLMEISTKAFNFYHCITESDADTDFCGVCVPRKSAMLELSSDKYLSKSGLLNSDCRIIKNLAELVKIQQIEDEFKCKYLTDSPVYPFSVSYLPIHTYRLQ